MLFANELLAVKAFPNPIVVTQPDGSKLTIQVHGDEFLGWTTCGNNLVERGKDGYYYYANFNSEGKVIITSKRVNPVQIFTTSTVRPPASAYAIANEKRKMMMQSASLIRHSGSSITQGKHNFLVLLIEFADLPFTIENPNVAFTDMLNKPNYSDNNATGSVHDYYYENSKGKFDPIFDVVGPIKVSKGYEYYSANKGFSTPGARDLLLEACNLIKNEVDFSKYDINEDGVIDNIFFYFAGHNMAEGANGHIWPHKWSVGGSNSFNGKYLRGYACTSEYSGSSGTKMCGIGTFCHEFGHVLGLPDFYDTDGEENGKARGLSAFSLMSNGNYNNSGRTPPYLGAVERNILGWMEEPEILTKSGSYSLEPIENNKAYQTPTINKGEYYLYENRQPNGWDKSLPGHGMLIYHIDKSSNMVGSYSARYRWEKGMDINAYLKHQCFDLVEAVYPESEIKNNSQVPFPGTIGKTSFNDKTSPSAISWNGFATGYNLSNIRESGNLVEFDLNIDLSKSVRGKVYDYFGNPIEKAVVTIKKVSNSQASAYSSNDDVCTTDKEGNYYLKMNDGDDFEIEVKCVGFETRVIPISMKMHGTYNLDITIYNKVENNYENIHKHSGDRFISMGYSGSSNIVYGSILYNAAEIKNSIGKSIKTISFFPSGTTATKVGVLVYFGDECVLSQSVPNPKFGTMNLVDISEAGLIIPKEKDVRVGYYIENSDSSYPLGCDAGPYVSGGGYISINGTDWINWYESYGMNYNLILSFALYDDVNFFYDLGYNYILNPKSEYSAGDKFSFKLVVGADAPKSVKWYYDNQEIKDENSEVVLTSGEHIIKALLTYSDNSTETIIQEIKVK